MPARKRYFYDTEFLEDGKTIELISIGIVCDDGREYYTEVKLDTNAILAIDKNEWLMENVVPSLTTINIAHNPPVFLVDDSTRPWTFPEATIFQAGGAYREDIRDGIMEFVGKSWPEFWAWYGAYDHVALCQLFGRMVDLPKNFPMFTRDIRQHWEYKGRPQLPQQTEGKHNALDDARHNKVMFDFLEAL